MATWKEKFSHSEVLGKEILLSPYIFILCVEFLDRKLLIHSENPTNHLGIQIHRNGPRISFLCS